MTRPYFGQAHDQILFKPLRLPRLVAKVLEFLPGCMAAHPG
jgi:hypothetical protein